MKRHFTASNARDRRSAAALLGRAPNQTHVDRFQRVIGDPGNAQLAVAVWADDAAFEEGALIDDIESVPDIRRQTHGKPGQRQALPARPAQLCISDPRRLPAIRPQRLVFDVARFQRFDRRDTERLDAQPSTAVADPAVAGEAPVAEPFEMQYDLGSDLVGVLAGGYRSGDGAIRPRTIEAA